MQFDQATNTNIFISKNKTNTNIQIKENDFLLIGCYVNLQNTV
jgi:hypothetical protein